MNKADWNSWRITGIPGELLEFLENHNCTANIYSGFKNTLNNCTLGSTVKHL